VLDDDDPAMISEMINFFYGVIYLDNRVTNPADAIDRANEQNSGIVDAAGALLSQHRSTSSVADGKKPRPTRNLTGPLITNVKMYILGDKYDIATLRSAAARKYSECIEAGTVVELCESVFLIWEAIVRDKDLLKDTALKFITAKLKTWLTNEILVDKPRSNSDIATDIIIALAARESKS
jgi:hypothetical protein